MTDVLIEAIRDMQKERKRVIHDLKSWSHFFQAIKSGVKTHDLRKNDRYYNVGDVIMYREYDFVNGCFTGQWLEAEITYMTDSRVPCAFSSAVLQEGYCILSIRVRPR